MLWRGLGSATTRLASLARAHWRPRQRAQDYNAPGMAVDISNEVLVSDHAPTRARPSPKPTACASLPHTFPLALSPEIPRELPLIRLITRSHASTPRTLHYMSYHLTIPTSLSSARAPSRSRLKAGVPSIHHDRGVGDGRVQAHHHDHAHDAAVVPPPPHPPSQIIVAYRLLLQVCGAASVEQWQRIHSHPLSLIIRRLHTQTSPSHRADVRALACERAFEYASDLPMPPLRVVSRNRMPVSSGFGLSSAVRKPID